MSFKDDMEAFVKKVKARERALFINSTSHVETSIKVGSTVTGAPGQPVDTGNLLNSWHRTFESRDVARVSTNVEYAPIIEDNDRGAVFKSAVGGAHSVKLTEAAWPKIVEHELRKLDE